jgi:hypothetical protein
VNWKNVIKDEVPSDKQEVLIAVKGIYYPATYIASQNGFRLHISDKFIPIKNSSIIYWAELRAQ